MKTKNTKTGLSFGKTALLLALGILTAALPARATLLFSGVEMGETIGRTSGIQWAAFAHTGGITIADTTVQTPIPAITGNLGVAASNITISGTTKVSGTAYIKTGGSLRRSGTAFVTGNGGLAVTNAGNDTLMNQVKADAISATTQANALANFNVGGFVNWGSLTNINQSTDLSVTDGGSGAHVVLHLTDFILTGGAKLTLTGTAAASYIINISGNFSLLNGKVLLAGGLLPENVLFNVVGAGSSVTLNGGAQYNGFILANDRTVNISGGSKITGTLIAGKVNISGGSKIIKPTYVSP